MVVSALKGYRVANLGQLWAGPVLGHLMADFGAEVIRVESAPHTDIFRRYPTLTGKPDVDLSANVISWSHGQMGITIDFTKPEGAELVKRLVSKSDVVVENFRPQTLPKYGLDYEGLKEVKPDIIMLSMSAAGQYGPLRDVCTYGPTLGALAGLTSLLGYQDGQPVYEIAYSDPIASVLGVFLILAALRHRNLTGEGQYIDMAQSEATTCLLGEAIMEYTMNGKVPSFQGNRSRWMAPHNLYRCLGDDKWVSIAVKTDEEWQSFCRALGDPPWTKQFADRFHRLRHEKELDAQISQWTARHTHYEVTETLQKARVAAAPSLDEAERLIDPQMVARQVHLQVDHPKLEGVIIYGLPWKLSETPGRIHRPGPMLGQHNDYVFRELLGMPEEEIARLTEAKVIH